MSSSVILRRRFSIMRRDGPTILFPLTPVLMVLAGLAHVDAQAPVGIDALGQPDLLPRFKPSVAVGSVSKLRPHRWQRRRVLRQAFLPAQGAQGLVIADLKGPGVVYRFWTLMLSDDLVEFFFDGEAAPRLRVPMRDLFTGRAFPFVSPIVGIGAGGFYLTCRWPTRSR